jgi:hypothetical protein
MIEVLAAVDSFETDGVSSLILIRGQIGATEVYDIIQFEPAEPTAE